MSDPIQDNKYVELKYRVIDAKTGGVLTSVDFPLGYVHGVNDVLSAQVMAELEGRTAGETISVELDCEQIFGPRDESLVVTDYLENVPEEYREVGTTVVMQNDAGQTKHFLVTRIDEKTLTVDGNHPLCGRQVVFELEILAVRDATEAEIAAGGKVESRPELAGVKPVPL
ncbi:FKBP-type peptidyl-prolyl cis-trans isomerase [Halochromatium glycolicum]|jgi:FKBP-type peptidyl-prolyl cis-trans isomerase SlyD|uniref:peptidylprolyl isomerase n=1 Tax=Halochromatium glycolicum TaxID=85075 RepID=A0AAJ0U2R8_9GAMM|nr:peptidylprolyl isomerase [Halochromatium glycolicum]MBK1703780.1 peptidylprolyl isomerase [Halochromatium glycolicum]